MASRPSSSCPTSGKAVTTLHPNAYSGEPAIPESIGLSNLQLQCGHPPRFSGNPGGLVLHAVCSASPWPDLQFCSGSGCDSILPPLSAPAFATATPAPGYPQHATNSLERLSNVTTLQQDLAPDGLQVVLAYLPPGAFLVPSSRQASSVIRKYLGLVGVPPDSLMEFHPQPVLLGYRTKMLLFHSHRGSSLLPAHPGPSHDND